MILFVKWNVKTRSLSLKDYIDNYAQRQQILLLHLKNNSVFPNNTEVVNMFTTKKLKTV